MKNQSILKKYEFLYPEKYELKSFMRLNNLNMLLCGCDVVAVALESLKAMWWEIYSHKSLLSSNNF